MSKDKDSKHTAMEEFFREIYGYVPNKKGTAYELIVSAALKLIDEKNQVFSDQRIRSAYSKQIYQLDSLIKSEFSTFVESKDYTDKNKPVGRPDVSKLAGALSDLNIDKGTVASATGFTKPAKEYAKASGQMTLGKEIDLLNIRPATEEDEKGRIKTIHLKMIFCFAVFEKAKWTPIFTNESQQKLKENYSVGTSIPMKLDNFYDSKGSIVKSIFDLTTELSTQGNSGESLSGSWGKNQETYILIGSELYEIDSLAYVIPFDEIVQEVVIESNGKAALLVQNEDGSLDKLLTDMDLKRIHISDNGEVKIN